MIIAGLHKDSSGKSPHFFRLRFLSQMVTECFGIQGSASKKTAEGARQREEAVDFGTIGHLSESRARRVLDDMSESTGQGLLSRPSVVG